MFQETKESQTHNCCEKCSMPPGPYFDCKKYDCDCHTVPAKMDIKTAITKAIEGGYNTHVWVPGDFIGHDAECIIFLDPLFWRSLYGSEKYGRIKALEFINAIFDGKSAENFFEQEPNLGKEQQEKTLS